MGFTVSTHFCGGHAVESVLAIGDQHLDCGMMEMKREVSDHPNDKAIVSKSACCSNEYSVYDIEDQYNSNSQSESINTDFLFAFVYTYIINDLDISDEHKSLICYSPPPLEQDVQVLHQTFLL